MSQANHRLRVTPVEDAPGLEVFLRLPWQVYTADPCWVPPLLPLQRSFLDRRSGPFFEFGEARYFLAYRGNRPVGRLSAHVNRLHEQYHDPADGFFGFFECLDDLEAAAALFTAAAEWLTAQGKKRLIGPLNFCIYDEMGLLVEGFDTLPAIFQTHNPPYYVDLLKQLGFTKVMDWYALRIWQKNIDAAPLEKRLEHVMARQKLTFTTFRPQDLTNRAQEVYNLFNEAWRRNWGHVPLTDRQFKMFFHELKPLLRPELVNLILDGDSLVAFNVVIPDLNPLIQKLNGKLSWWGKLRLYYAARFGPIQKARGLVLGVLQPYQNRGLHHALIIRTILNIVRGTTIQVCDLSLVPENLITYLKALDYYGAQRYKTFRVFQKDI